MILALLYGLGVIGGPIPSGNATAKVAAPAVNAKAPAVNAAAPAVNANAPAVNVGTLHSIQPHLPQELQ